MWRHAAKIAKYLKEIDFTHLGNSTFPLLLQIAHKWFGTPYLSQKSKSAKNHFQEAKKLSMKCVVFFLFENILQQKNISQIEYFSFNLQ